MAGSASGTANKIKEWWSVISTAAMIASAGAVGYYRLEQAEAHISQVEARLETKAEKADVETLSKSIEELRTTLGDIQLDMAQICAAQFGPEKCYTARRRR